MSICYIVSDCPYSPLQQFMNNKIYNTRGHRYADVTECNLIVKSTIRSNSQLMYTIQYL